MSETISAATIGAMIFSMCIAFALPIAAMIFAKIRLKGMLRYVFVGAAVFVLFVLVLESGMHALVIGIFGEGITKNIWIYALYGGLAAGLFEEIGRFLAMKFVMRRSLTKENAVMYGIGHGGIEAMILVGLTYVSNLITAVMINAGMLETILAGVPEGSRETTREQLSVLWTLPSYTFALAGCERVSAFVLHICLSYIVYRAAKDKKLLYYLLAVVIHAAVDAVAVLLGSMLPDYCMEIVLAAIVIILAVVTVKKYRAEA